MANSGCPIISALLVRLRESSGRQANSIRTRNPKTMPHLIERQIGNRNSAETVDPSL